MRRLPLDGALWIGALVFAGVAVVRARSPQGALSPAPEATRSAPSTIPPISAESVGDAAATLAANDPFRLANHPASVRYSAATDGQPTASAPSAPRIMRPNLAVKGIIGGPPWQAIVDGLPGAPAGTLVRSGDAFQSLIVQRITRDTVVIAAPDTTWLLTLTRPRS